jgi:uncharacterized protein
MNRREMLQNTGAAAVAVGLSSFPLGWVKADEGTAKKHIFCFTHSGSYQHDCVARHNGKPSLVERTLTELGKTHGFDVTCSKDGGDFDKPDIDKYDAFFFETQGDLLHTGSTGDLPMSVRGKKHFLHLIASGKGFVGSHCASDTCHSHGSSNENQPVDKRDPYIRMLGGEFIRHDSQQKAWMRVADHHFPGMKGIDDFALMEEWYALKNFSPNLHVILVQDTHGMKGLDYQRPNYPATWAHMYQKGRVFYTSMGHRDDVWKNHTFQHILLGGLAWALGNVEADVTPNLKQAAPHARTLPPYPKPRHA